MTRNPHAGEPFSDDDASIAAALEEVSIPALMCSLVHMTGDPSWIRGEIQPRLASLMDVQSGIPPAEQAEIRARALPAIAEYRDGGCAPVELSDDVVLEIMAFLGRRPVEGSLAEMMLDDLQLAGGDSNAITWGDTIPADVKAASHTLVIGCGMAGILAGIRLTQAGLPFTIVDKNGGPGGTWWENRYPGARVDTGSHQYCYSFEPSDHWSEFFCQHPEVRAYFSAVVDKYGLWPHCRFDTVVQSIVWDDERGGWQVSVAGADGKEEVLDTRFVISGVGSLNIPKLPDIPGMDTFAGPSFHSARWPEGLDIEGTRFALIGAGASGFQIGPAVADDVESLTIFQRTAQWILPNPLYHAPVPDGDRWASRHLPFFGRWYRFLMTYPGLAMGMEPYRIDPAHEDETRRSISEAHAQRAAALLGSMTALVDDDSDLLEKITPDYPSSGKRMLQDDGTWLRTLQRPDVELVRTAIDHIEPDAVVTVDGVRHPADVICFATGFRHNDFLASLDVRGREGQDLRELWGIEPTAYLGITVAGFPNLFCVYGPGTNLAAGASLFYHAEFQVHYALEAIRETLASGARVCEVTRSAHDDYAERYEAEIGQMVWSHPAIEHSHYKNPDGKVWTLSPWALDRYRIWTRSLDREDYTFST